MYLLSTFPLFFPQPRRFPPPFPFIICFHPQQLQSWKYIPLYAGSLSSVYAAVHPAAVLCGAAAKDLAAINDVYLSYTGVYIVV